RRGAKLIVTKLDGQQIKGELITVKPNSLLLLDTEGKDVSIDIADIKVIRIMKKSKVLQGLSLGLMIGGGLGALYALSTDVDPWGEITDASEGLQVISWAPVFAAPGLLIGAIIGGIAGTDKTIQIEGMSDSEIQETLDKLRKKARIRDYK
ncbi:MAG: hypothetical protein GTO16_10870, partial [Candidatus Aminicenantes bacterium]|nr:hypothetical protein [Candidatus Aminicenantes bacterium]